ncbi:MAG: 30S ribosomal protein S2 [bacterium]|nr:30S ribosomal protein S2 [bacterium]
MQDYASAEIVEVDMSLKSLLQAGVHFGHQTSRWNPAMSQYIHTARNGIHIINLPSSVECWSKAEKVITDITSAGGSVLFVGTKKQSQDIVRQEANRCGCYYVSRRWLGGMLTNFSTIRNSIERMKKLEGIMQEESERATRGESMKFTKKERLMMQKELEKLEFSIGGIREMTSLPSLIFVIDIRRENIAISEARRLDIPVVALVDTNCNPSEVDYPVPANDDGSRSIRLFSQAVANAVIRGRQKMVERTRSGAVITPASFKKKTASEGAKKPADAVVPASVEEVAPA